MAGPRIQTKYLPLFLNLAQPRSHVWQVYQQAGMVMMCEYLLRAYLVPSGRNLQHSVKNHSKQINTENTKLKKDSFDEYYESEECCALRERNKINVFCMGIGWPENQRHRWESELYATEQVGRGTAYVRQSIIRGNCSGLEMKLAFSRSERDSVARISGWKMRVMVIYVK